MILRILLYLKDLLHKWIQKELNMSTLSSSIMLACHPTALPTLKIWMRDNFGILPTNFDLAILLGREGGDYNNPLFVYGAMSLTAAQVSLLRPAISPGGDLYAAGIRARRLFFAHSETTTNEAGKLQVTLIDAGQEIPAGMTAELWGTHRLTQDKFFEELGGAEGPVTQLIPPEPAILVIGEFIEERGNLLHELFHLPDALDVGERQAKHLVVRHVVVFHPLSKILIHGMS